MVLKLIFCESKRCSNEYFVRVRAPQNLISESNILSKKAIAITSSPSQLKEVERPASLRRPVMEALNAKAAP